MKLLLIIYLLSIPLLALAAQSKVNESGFVDHVHNTLSGDVLSLANSLDNFFGSERADEESNNTRIRLYSITTKLEAQNPTTEGFFKLQLVLPKTQKRLQFVLESDDDSNDESAASNSGSAAAKTTASSTNGQDVADATTAALRYIVDTAGIRTSFDSGIRVTDRVQFFYRIRLRKNIPFKKWVFRPVEQIKWLQDDGHSSITDLDFDRGINKVWHFRFYNNIFWKDDDYILSFNNGPSWFQKINEKMGLSYNARMQSSNTPIYSVNNYSLSIGYRQLLYKKWFFWSLSPALNFQRENNFHRVPSLTMRFDVIIGRI